MNVKCVGLPGAIFDYPSPPRRPAHLFSHSGDAVKSTIGLGRTSVENKEYVNPFVDIRNKVAAFKAQAREMSKKDGELRESRSRQEAEELLKNKPARSLRYPPSR
jgi:hypothetical protein